MLFLNDALRTVLANPVICRRDLHECDLICHWIIEVPDA